MYFSIEPLCFERGRIRPVHYADTEHYRVTRDFLLDPERAISRLFAEEANSDEE